MAVFALVRPWLGDGPVPLSLDDTLARKGGLKIFGAGMHHDPLLSSRKVALVHWGHSWVVLSVIVAFPFRPGRGRPELPVRPHNDNHVRLTARPGWFSTPYVLYFLDEFDYWAADVPIDHRDGVRFEWTFLSDTEYGIKVKDATSSELLHEEPLLTVWTGYTIADIMGLRVGLWDSEQTLTFSNFEINPEPECPGDVDGDGDTDLSDLAALLAAYGSSVGDPNYNPNADFDGNRCVNLFDLAILLSNFRAGT